MQCAFSILPVACPELLYFSTLSLKGCDLKKNIGHKMCVLISSTTFDGNFCHSKKQWTRYYSKCLAVFIKSARCSCLNLMKLEFSWQFFEKYSNINFHDNQSSGSRVVSFGQTDGWTDMTKLIVAFQNFANEPKTCQMCRQQQNFDNAAS